MSLQSRLALLITAIGTDVKTLTTKAAITPVVVDHGSNASTARPAGAILVIWRGTVVPTNAIANDIRIDTT